ncbi:hypothetical protein DSO57_1036050 [Entomophthora muscae]|uniref:Uncharacterized protein n=1 Tax=Entomophthora muscae TaxID=34485 RepID=A0ACC2SZI2_9FUNG|nr:hypothetical protein DSO57_1036050 [Entomophthora muscae]
MEPMLIHPNFNENFSIFTDVSEEATGGVLAQEREGVFCLVGYTNNLVLSFILSKQQENSRQAHWVMEMSKYLMDIKHIPGKKNMVANRMSQQGEQEMYLVEQLAESYETKLFAIYRLLTT